MAAAPKSGPPGEEQHSVGAQQQARRGRQQNRRQQQPVSSRAPSRTSPAQARRNVMVVSFLTRAARQPLLNEITIGRGWALPPMKGWRRGGTKTPGSGEPEQLRGLLWE